MFFGRFCEQLQIQSSTKLYRYKNLYLFGELYGTNSDYAAKAFEMYEKYGDDFANHLDGSFVVVILKESALYIYRDFFGKKPLYYLVTDDTIYFSEMIKPLKEYLPKKSLSIDGLCSYLSFLAPTPPYTLYKDIYKLGSGEYLIYNNAKLEIRFYENLLTPQEGNLQNLLQNAVAKNISNNHTLLLSGGLDSAMIAAFARDLGIKHHSISIDFDGYKNYSENENTKYSANFLGIELEQITITKDIFLDGIDGFLEYMDEPLNDPAAYMLDFITSSVKTDNIISGEGSDELFLGYRQYFEYLDIEKLSYLKNKNWLKRYFHSNFSMNREWEWYKRVFDDTLLFRTSGEKFSDLHQNRLLRQNIKDNNSLKYLQRYIDRCDSDDKSIWYSYIDLKLFMGEAALSKLHKITSHYHKNSNTPFLDINLARFTLSQERLISSGTKPLLKELARAYLDESIINRKKKGLSYPYMEWLLQSDRVGIIKEVNAKTKLFNDEVIDKYIQMASRGRFKHQLWGLFILSHFIKREFL